MELEAKTHFLNNCTIWSDRYDNYLKVQVSSLLMRQKSTPDILGHTDRCLKNQFLLQQINL